MSETIERPEISCDRCVTPGMCCKAFPLNQNFHLGTSLETLTSWLAEQGYPFVPLRRYQTWVGQNTLNEPSGVWFEQWQFQCTKLGADGRCTIYENRPNLCKIYDPGHDAMCVHMRMPDGQPVIPQLPIVEVVA